MPYLNEGPSSKPEITGKAATGTCSTATVGIAPAGYALRSATREQTAVAT
jgi:hypothetical protein